MENLVFSNKDKLATLVSAKDLDTHGYMIVPFTRLNPSLYDLISVYLKPNLTFGTYKRLSKLDVTPSQEMLTCLNVFKHAHYDKFLQMVCKENYRSGSDTNVTKEYDVVYGPALVSTNGLPVLGNNPRDIRKFKDILNSEYAQVFNPNTIWLIRVVTECTQGFSRQLMCEYNLFLPKGVCICD